MKSLIRYGYVLMIPALCACAGINRQSALSDQFSDIHLHYNWDQKEIIAAADVIRILEQHKVTLGVVSATPTELALELYQADPKRIIPLFSPYLTQEHKQRWYLDNEVVTQAREGLRSKQYHGIGELHLWSNMPPRFDNRVLNGLLDLTEEFDAPFLIHTEASDMRFFLELCLARPKVRFLWAHAGGILDAHSVAALMQQCANVWVELSARDTWRYNTLTDDTGTLPLAWAKVIAHYADRFMTGTDPVWAVTRMQRWDEADDGWNHYQQLIDYHKHWLKQLPEEVAYKVQVKNAEDFFRVVRE